MDHPMILGLSGPEVRVSGQLARRLVRPLERAIREAERNGERIHPEVGNFLTACQIAGQRYVDSVASAHGSSRRQSAPESSSSAREIDTNAAGQMIGTTSRNVVDLLNRKRLPGRQVGRKWLLDPVDVLAYREETR